MLTRADTRCTLQAHTQWQQGEVYIYIYIYTAHVKINLPATGARERGEPHKPKRGKKPGRRREATHQRRADKPRQQEARAGRAKKDRRQRQREAQTQEPGRPQPQEATTGGPEYI